MAASICLGILFTLIDGCATVGGSPAPSIAEVRSSDRPQVKLDEGRSPPLADAASINREPGESVPIVRTSLRSQGTNWFRESQLRLIRLDGDVTPEAARDLETTTAIKIDWDERLEDDLPTFQSKSKHGHTTYRELAQEQGRGILSDHLRFYSAEGLGFLAVGVGAGAAMANTGFDEKFIRDEYIESIVRAPSDELYEAAHEPKFLGDGTYTLPLFAVLALSEPLFEENTWGHAGSEWGQRSLRTILVGAPPMLALQMATGGSRPGETDHTSHWVPFQDNNGVSGHSFMGAVPFLSAAKMTDNGWLKGGLYVASALPALSRVNDDDHYFSQAFLGWWLAYMAATAVDGSFDPDGEHHFFAYPTANGMGFGYEHNY